MPIDRGTLDDAIASAARFATEGAPDALERFGALVGLDTAQIGSGVGDLDAVMAVLLVPARRVKALLPVGLELAPNPLAPVGMHPVLVQLSHWQFSFGNMDYSESMVAVPYVQLTSYDAPRRGPFLYMPRLYLNEELPRLLGVYLYGYEKEEASITRDLAQGRYRVNGESNAAPRLEATFTSAGARKAPGAFANFAQVRQLLEMPTISQAARIWNSSAASSPELSPMLASNLVYHFDEPGASLEPVHVRLTIGHPFTPSGLMGNYELPSLEHATLGAFRIAVKVGVALPSSPATLRYPVPTPAQTGGKKQRVLVLGGGPAACAAAYWLARQRDRYEVQVYTQGFRLGGKCAAGRNPRADMRIEEHGLHAFLGFYQNAFRTMRSVYQTAGLPIAAGGQPVGAAFLGSNQNGLMIDVHGGWKYFRTPLPLNDFVPGHVPKDARADDEEDLSLHDLASKAGLGSLILESVRHAVRQTQVMDQRNVEAVRAMTRAAASAEKGSALMSLVDRVRGWREELNEEIDWHPSQLMRYALSFLEDRAERVIEGWLAEGVEGPLAPVLAVVRLVIRLLDESVERHPGDDEVWYRWMSLSSVLTAVAGLIEDRVTHLDQLDEQDMWAWFQRHRLDPRLIPEGLRKEPVEGGQVQGSPIIAAVYETLFAHGATAEPRDLAAGVGLRWFFLTAIGYAGFPAYEFKYSASQTLLTPYYKALTGPLEAEVHFFHRVTSLDVEVVGGQRRLRAVRLQRQATVKPGRTYDPFAPDMPAQNPAAQPDWPMEPNYDQLVEGDLLRAEKIDLESPYSPWPGVGEVVLRAGEDFDLCILGIALGALPSITTDLWQPGSPAYEPRWERMLRDVAITRTISMQLWFDRPERDLYDVSPDVDGKPGTGRGLLTGYVLPEPSMGDLSHLVHWEGWTPAQPPKFLAYHTGSLTAKSALDLPPLHDHEYPARADARWRKKARRWLKKHYAGFYSKVPSWDELQQWLAVPSSAAPDADRFAAQYFNAGPQPSDHYVLSQPKGMPARMGQMESGVVGLFLCGDWTRTDMNCGCVEAATQSGMLCARGLSGHPVYVWHPGF